MGDRGRQAAGDVAGDVLAADRDRIDVHQVAFVEHRERGRAAAHIDQGGAEVALVGDQRAQARGVARHHPLGDLEMGAPHADLQVAHRPARRGDQVDVDAEPLAEHAAGVAHRGAVDRVADRRRVDDVAVRRLARQGDVLLHPADVALADLVMADRDLEVLVVRGGRAAAHADDHLADMLAAHLLGGRHRRGDGAGRSLHVDDVARAHALRRLMADADHPQPLPIDPRNKADDLVGADVERRNHPIPCLGHDVSPCLYATFLRF